jgi:hypothetical protein
MMLHPVMDISLLINSRVLRIKDLAIVMIKRFEALPQLHVLGWLATVGHLITE